MTDLTTSSCAAQCHARINAAWAGAVAALATVFATVIGLPAPAQATSAQWGSDNAVYFSPARQKTFPSPRKLGAALPPDYRPRKQRTQKQKAQRNKNVHLAALTPEAKPQTKAPAPSLSGGSGVRWVANSGCLASSLHAAIAHVAAHYGHVTVNSTCRSPRHNRRVGGARKSYHLTGSAADIRVRGNLRGAIAYLRSVVGGFKHYGGGRFHIDNGPRRTF
jgi:hypothetical protein